MLLLFLALIWFSILTYNKLYDNVEAGFGYNKDATWEDLIAASRAKEANMKANDTWKHVSPQNAQILALTTQVAQLKASMDAPANHRGGPKEGTGSKKFKTAEEYFNQPNPVIKKWRTEKKGDTIEMEGRRYYWCKHHKHPQGFYDGLYVSSHKEIDHDCFVAGGKKTIG